MKKRYVIKMKKMAALFVCVLLCVGAFVLNVSAASAAYGDGWSYDGSTRLLRVHRSGTVTISDTDKYTSGNLNFSPRQLSLDEGVTVSGRGISICGNEMLVAPSLSVNESFDLNQWNSLSSGFRDITVNKSGKIVGGAYESGMLATMDMTVYGAIEGGSFKSQRVTLMSGASVSGGSFESCTVVVFPNVTLAGASFKDCTVYVPDSESAENELFANSTVKVGIVSEVSASGTLKHGETLTAEVTTTVDGIEGLEYRWYYDKVTLSTEPTCLLDVESAGKNIYLEVKNGLQISRAYIGRVTEIDDITASVDFKNDSLIFDVTDSKVELGILSRVYYYVGELDPATVSSVSLTAEGVWAGIPYLTPAFASASANIYAKAGAEPAIAVNAEKYFSSRRIAFPKQEQSSRTNSFSSHETFSEEQTAVMDSPTAALIFGIMRTVFAAKPKRETIFAVSVPAAVEIIKGLFSFASAFISSASDAKSLGLTAITMLSQLKATSFALPAIHTESSSASLSSF